MTINRMFLVVAALTALATSACGDPQGDTSPTDASQTTTSASEPPPTTAKPQPSREDPYKAVSENKNTRDGDVGSLCWARWELARAVVLGQGNADRADEAVAAFSQRRGAVEGELGAIRGNLPTELRPFVDRYRSDIREAGRVLAQSEGESGRARMNKVSDVFAWSEYPGLSDYERLSAKDPDCRTP